MATTIKFDKLLHRKMVEVCSPLKSIENLVNDSNGKSLCSCQYGYDNEAFIMASYSASQQYMYDARSDSWIDTAASTSGYNDRTDNHLVSLGAWGGTFEQTATGGTTSSIQTNKTLVSNCVGRKLRVVGGAGLGYEGEILYNTIGTNSTVYLKTPHTVSFDSTTKFVVYTYSYFVHTNNTFNLYDFATGVTTTKATGATNSQNPNLVSGIGASLYDTSAIAKGTATGATLTTLVNSSKSWGTNMWTNMQVRITKGTGKGQYRTIVSNTGTTLTIDASWEVTPDTTSEYVIEENDDLLYFFAGSGATNSCKFSMKNNMWTNLATRGTSCGTAILVNQCPNWYNETLVPHMGTTVYKQNGRFVYTSRDTFSADTFDIYDIATNTWTLNVSITNLGRETIGGSSRSYYKGNIYYYVGTRIIRLDIDRNEVLPYANFPIVKSTTQGENRMALVKFKDGDVEIPFIYYKNTGNAEFYRMMMVGE